MTKIRPKVTSTCAMGPARRIRRMKTRYSTTPSAATASGATRSPPQKPIAAPAVAAA